MVVSTVTIHPTIFVTLNTSSLPSSAVSTSMASNADNPKNSGLYPSGHGYGVAIWFGIASAILAATLILIYLGWIIYKATKRTRERRYMSFFFLGLSETLLCFTPFLLDCSQNMKGAKTRPSGMNACLHDIGNMLTRNCRRQRRMREWYGRNMRGRRGDPTIDDPGVELTTLRRPTRMRISG